MSGAALVLAVGFEVSGGPMPLHYLHGHVPGMGGIRAPARFVVVALLGLAILAAHGVAFLTTRLPRRVAPVAAFLIGAFLLCELAAPIPRVDLPTGTDDLAVYRALATKPAGAVVELPLIDPSAGDGFVWVFVETPRMLYATLDWHPRLNGYSGSFPDGYRETGNLANEVPAPEAFAALRALHVRYLVLHTGPQPSPCPA